MSIEKALADLTAAVKANTEAHEKLAEVAKATQAGRPEQAEDKPARAKTTTSKAKATEEKAAEDTATDEAEATEQQEAPKKAAAKKPTARKTATKKATKPDPITSIEFADLKNMARTFINPDDEEQRDENKGKLGAALDHIGAESLGKVDEEDMPRVATYLAYWSVGLEVDFEEIDALIAEASDDDESGQTADDEMLG